jgi:hypothetical protein
VQRFGSKRDLLLKLSGTFSGGTGRMFTELRRGRRSPLATLRAYSDCMAQPGGEPGRVRAQLRVPADRPDGSRIPQHLVTHARASRLELQKLIKEAIDAKELSPIPMLRQLARTVEAVVNGSMLSWAFLQEGAARKWMRHDLDAILKPYTCQSSQGAWSSILALE